MVPTAEVGLSAAAMAHATRRRLKRPVEFTGTLRPGSLVGDSDAVAVREMAAEPASHAARRFNGTVRSAAHRRWLPLVVCELNQAPVEGLLDAAGDLRQALLDPKDGRCCVVITADPL
jgi:hypothetical protein